MTGIKKNKKAIVTGIRGQDAAHLSSLLIHEGYDVYGGDRRSGNADYWRLDEIGVRDKVKLIPMDLTDEENIIRVIRDIRPDEIYHLGAMSFVKTSWDFPSTTININALSTLKILEAIRTHVPKCKFYFAASSEMFGKVVETPQSENTPFYPRSPYGISKLMGYWLSRNYRESFDIFACNGILFNHCGMLRGEEFITRKVSMAVSRILLNMQDELIVGNINAKRDWHYAGDSVRAMHAMMQQEYSDDYIIASGETHSIKELIEVAFGSVGIHIVWEGRNVNEQGIDAESGKILVKCSPEFYRPAEVDLLLGDPSKAKVALKWEPTVSFNQLIEDMVSADIKRISKGINE